MATGPRYSVKFRRRRSGRTDYHKRIALIKSKLPRFVIRISNKFIIVQFIQYIINGDKTIVAVNSNQLKKLGWASSGKNLPAAYLTGLLAGKLAKDHKIDKAVFDIGRKTSTKGNRLYAALKGVIDAGVEIPHGEEVFPEENRLKGAHINESVPKDFEKVKANILKVKVVEKPKKAAKEAKQ